MVSSLTFQKKVKTFVKALWQDDQGQSQTRRPLLALSYLQDVPISTSEPACPLGLSAALPRRPAVLPRSPCSVCGVSLPGMWAKRSSDPDILLQPPAPNNPQIYEVSPAGFLFFLPLCWNRCWCSNLCPPLLCPSEELQEHRSLWPKHPTA